MRKVEDLKKLRDLTDSLVDCALKHSLSPEEKRNDIKQDYYIIFSELRDLLNYLDNPQEEPIHYDNLLKAYSNREYTIEDIEQYNVCSLEESSELRSDVKEYIYIHLN